MDNEHYKEERYKDKLPMDLDEWARLHQPDKNLIYGESMYEQVRFVRNVLWEMLAEDYKEWNTNQPTVISTHRSKSVLLPVYLIQMPKYKLELVMRGNFYDWKLSVKSLEALEFDSLGLFDLKEEIPYYYCEGFPMDKIYGSYAQNHAQFTVGLRSDHDLYALACLIKSYLIKLYLKRLQGN